MIGLKNKPILVTGGAGYIGSVLVRQLLASGYKVRVADMLRFGGESLLEVANNPDFEFFKIDIRESGGLVEAVRGCGAVVHLAAIVGDPACTAEPELARSINLDASMNLYRIANDEGCDRFVFASTCSNYGKMSDPDSYVNEESTLSPVSLYAETKVGFEKFLFSQSKYNICKPTCLRFATVYGLSPRVRFDLTVNEFTKELVLGRELLIFGEQFWRPYCHVQDLARSIGLVLGCNDGVDFEVFNVGDTAENYTKKMIVSEIVAQLPDSRIQYVPKNEDPRDYRVNFDKIKTRLGFSITKKVSDGISEIVHLLRTGLISDPDNKCYYNN
jgi:nucleoside-diphosphate-sugar epimerase